MAISKTMKQRRRFHCGGTWKNPERLAQYVALCILYFLGLLAFQRFTGLLGPSGPIKIAPIKLPDSHVYSSDDVREYLYLSQAEIQPSPLFRHLLAEVQNKSGTEKDAPPDPFFPPDIFTMEQKRSGAVALHILGLIYMFAALAIVCDEFFVPSLDVIIDVIGCSEDVAGATFMAAGGSAPELFTSIIGVFIAFSDVGIGTIVGSAVFNILFVIGMCALFSKTILHLTWWPLFRDCTFYSISLIALIGFFLDEKIEWYEAALLLLIYACYVIFMKFNPNTERFVKKILFKNKVTRVCSTDHLVPNHPSAAAALAGVTGAAMSGVVAGEGARTSIPVLHSGTHFRHGLLQLMIHTIDPLHDGKVDEKATQLHAIASLKVLLDATKPQDGLNGNATNGDQTHDSGRASQGTEVTHVDAFTNADQLSQTGRLNGINMTSASNISTVQQTNDEVRIQAALAAGDPPPSDQGGMNLDEVQPEPLDMSFPRHGLQKQCTYLLLFPIIFPLWLTLPDTRNPRARKFFPITFIGSILWIAIFSYMMVWWATYAGDVFNIPPPVMGLTFLAAGTSIPDLITSVIVARKGFGDMAVSSSVGSNIFDVTVGLPFPWLLFTIVFGKPVPVSATGMVCSIAILFGMLMLVFFSILVFNWKMTKGMGFSMFVFYFIFVAVSLGFEYDFYDCPM
ncbi:sodium/potassium/calcium exchanger Nckx30C-like isoform X5 [Tigriopus californicus]|uniref:sodium/potassium/calcium exchanger Nckx30C-like isoform X5 n=1 Tax=Tigriopus californicus TaxID=6832 RepID=UPI0027DA0E4A|nr:sodium/potassium/calcium exchanger Nckx30C-like isoform X5 [Tigriopus californicus]